MFALYIADLGQELVETRLGVVLYRVCISAIFFAVSQDTKKHIRSNCVLV